MKSSFMFLLIAIPLLSSCLTSHSVGSLENSDNKLGAKGVAVLATDPEDSHFAECIRERLEKDLMNMSFMEGENFRNSLYPWFEPTTMPNSIIKLSAVLSKTMVRDRINSLGVELLIFVKGDTWTEVKYGWAGGFDRAAAFWIGESRETDISISIWNLNDVDYLGGLDVESKGTVHYGIVVLPYFIPARTETACCRETADRISSWLIECGYAGSN